MWPEPDSCIDPNFGWGQPFQGSLGHGTSTGGREGKKSLFVMGHLSRQLHFTFQNATASLALELPSGFTSKSVLQSPLGLSLHLQDEAGFSSVCTWSEFIRTQVLPQTECTRVK